MKEQFCSYEISLKLKELGFNEPCFGYFHSKRVSLYPTPFHPAQYGKNSEEMLYHTDCTAPLWQQAIDWFLKTYDIFITILRTKDGFVFLIPEIENDTYGKVIYEALHLCREQSILKAIELCQNKK